MYYISCVYHIHIVQLTVHSTVQCVVQYRHFLKFFIRRFNYQNLFTGFFVLFDTISTLLVTILPLRIKLFKVLEPFSNSSTIIITYDKLTLSGVHYVSEQLVIESFVT